MLAVYPLFCMALSGAAQEGQYKQVKEYTQSNMKFKSETNSYSSKIYRLRLLSRLNTAPHQVRGVREAQPLRSRCLPDNSPLHGVEKTSLIILYEI